MSNPYRHTLLAKRLLPRLEPLEDRTLLDVGDTLATAWNTNLGPGPAEYVGFAERVGDGAQTTRDVDLYRFQANAGLRLVALTARPAGGQSVDSVLRLFDATGQQLGLNDNCTRTIYSPLPVNYSCVNYLVIPATGTYYAGVSGAPNLGYNPTVAGSGVAGGVGDSYVILRLTEDLGDELIWADNTNLGPAPGSFTAPPQQGGNGLHGGRDVDLYRFQAGAGQRVTAVTSLPPGGQPMNTVLRLFNAAGQGLATNDDCTASTRYSCLTGTFLPAAGTYYIGVSGSPNSFYDPTVAGGGFAGSTGEFRLQISLEVDLADAGDSLATAQNTNLGPTPGSHVSGIHRVGNGAFGSRDVDIFRFQANAGQRINAAALVVAGLGSAYLRLFNAAGQDLTPSAACLPSSSACINEFLLGATGVYYLGVSAAPNVFYNPMVAGSGILANTFDYRLNLELTDAGDLGDSLATAHVPRIDYASYQRTDRIGDGPYTTRDVDLYRFESSAGQRVNVQTAQAGTPMNTVLRLFNASGQPLAVNDDCSGLYSCINDFSLPGAGIYYVGVSGAPNTGYNPTLAGSGVVGSTGEYRLSLSLVTAADRGDTLATAEDTRLGPGQGAYDSRPDWVGDGVHTTRDVDLYSLQAFLGARLTATTTLPFGGQAANTILRVFNATGTQLASNDDCAGSQYSCINDFTLPADGTYYVGVSGAPNAGYNPSVAGSGVAGSMGNYQLALQLVPADVGDTLATAFATNVGPAPGRFSYTAQVGDGPQGARDVDLYRFQASAGQAITAATASASGPGTNTVVRLFNAAGTPLAANDDCGINRYSCLNDFVLPAAGTYYVGVSGSPNSSYNPTVAGSGVAGATGTYPVTLTLTGPATGPADIGDNAPAAFNTNLGPGSGTYALASQPIGNGFQGHLDVDLFRFEARATATITAVTSQPAGGRAMQTVLRLFDATGRALTQMIGCGASRYACINNFTLIDGGTYYIGVSGWPNTFYHSFVSGSGNPSFISSTGDYRLDLTLTSPPATVALRVQPSTTTPTAGIPFQILVTALDASGNRNPSYRGTVAFSASDGQATVPGNYTFTLSDSGQRGFVVTARTAGPQTITVRDTVTGAITGTASVTVQPATAAALRVTPTTATPVAGSPFSLTVTVLDSFGNRTPSYRGTVSFTSSDNQATLPTNYTFTVTDSGEHSFPDVIVRTAGAQTVTARDRFDGRITGVANVNVNPGPTSVLLLVAVGDRFTAGVPFALTVTAQDAFGNRTPAYRGTVTFTSSDGQATVPTDYTFIDTDNGQHLFDAVTLRTAEVQEVQVTDTVSGDISGAVAILVEPGPVTFFYLFPDYAEVNAGQAFDVYVFAYDEFFNLATHYRGEIVFFSTDEGATVPKPYTFTEADAGALYFPESVTLFTLGFQELYVFDTETYSLIGYAGFDVRDPGGRPGGNPGGGAGRSPTTPPATDAERFFAAEAGRAGTVWLDLDLWNRSRKRKTDDSGWARVES